MLRQIRFYNLFYVFRLESDIDKYYFFLSGNFSNASLSEGLKEVCDEGGILLNVAGMETFLLRELLSFKRER